ncbi:hypothetical protein O9993_21445 [Vibrio lentus]|nr:hypothetical protein [Vibrio lentus]
MAPDGVFQDNGDGSYAFLLMKTSVAISALTLLLLMRDGSIDETTAGITVLEVNDPPVAGQRHTP